MTGHANARGDNVARGVAPVTREELRIMALKPSDVLDRLPSASELLEKPPIRALADRWNRSVVASGVRSFLDELRSDWERRSGDWHLPSLRELAQRAARHVVAMQQAKVRPTINATGTFSARIHDLAAC